MTSNEAAHEGTGEETLQTPRRPWVVMAVSECKWGQDDGVGRYCLTHEAWMRAVIGTQCPVGELRAQVQRVRKVCKDAPLYWTEELGDEPAPVVYVATVLRALDGTDE